MKRRDIEQAANGKYPDNTFAYKGFIAGVDWCMNSVWHDAREEPIKEKGRWLAFCGGIKVFLCEEWHGQFLWSGYVSMLGIVAWVYVEDLLPMKGGVE